MVVDSARALANLCLAVFRLSWEFVKGGYSPEEKVARAAAVYLVPAVILGLAGFGAFTGVTHIRSGPSAADVASLSSLERQHELLLDIQGAISAEAPLAGTYQPPMDAFRAEEHAANTLLGQTEGQCVELTQSYNQLAPAVPADVRLAHRLPARYSARPCRGS